jgi:hypothetical protein
MIRWFSKTDYEMRFDYVSAVYALFGQFTSVCAASRATGKLAGGRIAQ